MINTASGVEIPFPEEIEENFIKLNNRIDFNISFEKLEPLFYYFFNELSEPIFLFMHVPLNEKEEKEIQKNGEEEFHSEVLYLDGQNKSQIIEIMDEYGELLFNDGMSEFGIASHKTGDEIHIKKYKIVSIYSKTVNKYIPYLKKYNITETNSLVTAWNTFSNEYPGIATAITVNNLKIYDILDLLKEKGMYRAKIIKS